ncbi:MAG: restriction endonuclease subunit S [Tenericutes bacterium]|nr:restriction endonuclease subunit S [Mycoplasmatota bacterium]
MKSICKKLGVLVEKVDNRNADSNINELRGVKITKEFMPSVANIHGTDMKKYKIVYHNMFTANLMHVDRDKIIPIALWEKEYPIIVSPAYDVFRIKDGVGVIPEYLMLCFKRKDFDRNGWFFSGSSIRGNLTWDKICDIKIPVPSLEAQRKIVSRYSTFTKRIVYLSNLVKIFRNIGVNILKKKFDANKIDPLTIKYDDERLKAYSINTLDKIARKINAGGTPSRDLNEYWEDGSIPWLKIGEINNSFIFDSEEYITNKGLSNSSAKIVNEDSLLLSMYCVSEEPNVGINKFLTTTNQAICAIEFDDYNRLAYMYFYFLAFSRRMLRRANGSVQTNLSKKIIQEFHIIDIYKEKSNYTLFTKILNQIENYERQRNILEEMQALLIFEME